MAPYCELSTNFPLGPAGPMLQRGVVASLGSERWANPGIMRPGVQDIYSYIFFYLFLLVGICL